MALFITHSAAVSGAEISLGTYLLRAPRDHLVLVLAEGASVAYFTSLGVATAVVPMFGNRKVSRDLSFAQALHGAASSARTMRQLLRAIRSAPQEVVVTNSMKAHAVGAPAARAAGRSVGIRLHDILDPDTASPTARGILRGASFAADSTAAVSRATADVARRGGLRRVTYFYNGVSLPPPRDDQRAPGPLRLLAVSQLARWKGADDVLECVALARREIPELQLDVVGDAVFGDARYRDELYERTRVLGLSDVVRWHGFQPDPTPFFRAADLFLHLPKRPEPLGLALMEAQAHGVPAIASGIGGIPEVVDDGVTGFLVEADNPAAAADKLVHLDRSRSRAVMGAAGRARMGAIFSEKRYLDSFDSWIEDVRRRRGEVVRRLG